MIILLLYLYIYICNLEVIDVGINEACLYVSTFNCSTLTYGGIIKLYECSVIIKDLKRGYVYGKLTKINKEINTFESYFEGSISSCSLNKCYKFGNFSEPYKLGYPCRFRCMQMEKKYIGEIIPSENNKNGTTIVYNYYYASIIISLVTLFILANSFTFCILLTVCSFFIVVRKFWKYSESIYHDNDITLK